MSTLANTNLKLTLEPLEDENSPSTSKPGTAVGGDLLGANISYAINSIPTADISVPLGSKLEQGGYLSPSWVHSELKNAIAERKPYGIYLDIDPGEWYDTPTGKICLFKGYITSVGMNLEHGRGSASVGLTHWLSDLDMFSILNPLSSPDNPMDVATNPITDISGNKGKSSKDGSRLSWTPGQKARKIVKDSKTVWDAILALLTAAMKEGSKTKKEIAGHTNQLLFNKVESALASFNGEHSKLVGSTDMHSNWLSSAIGTVLSSQIRSEYYSITIWQKLISVLLPQFYLSVLPTVDKAYVAPDPGFTTAYQSWMPEFSRDDTISVQYNQSGGGVVGGMVLIGADPIVSRKNKSSRLSKFQYPTPAKAGVMKAAYMPEWLSSAKRIAETVNRKGPLTLGCFIKGAPAAADTAEQQTTGVDTNELCNNWVKGAYINEVTKGNRATITLNFNPKFMLGTLVKVTAGQDILTEKETMALYGIVQSVTHHIGKDQVSTTISLSNVRDENLQNSLPQLDGMIYENTKIEDKLYTEVGDDSNAEDSDGT